MPRYDFCCEKCKLTLELVQKMTDEHTAKCPQCHKTMRRVYTSVQGIFKGEGFTLSADAKEERDVWRDTSKKYY